MGTSSTMNEVISLPKGGGALHGLGEKFSPDLHTGTGNFTVPIALPPGRNGFQPQLNVAYSTGNGNGLFGLGWGLSIPGVSRKTSQGIPRYRDYDPKEKSDVFILSGAEDLVPINNPADGITRYRPRTEGLFARIDHHHSSTDDYWEVRSKDGLVSIYGTPGKLGFDDSAAIARNLKSKFAWKLTETRDPFGNRIRYSYIFDQGQDGPHAWNQPALSCIEYADVVEGGNTRFLISVSFDYGPDSDRRPDPFSDYRAGFEVRTTKRCQVITVQTHFEQTRPVRAYKFSYDNSSLNHVSLLNRVDVVGYDDAGQEAQELPPLSFGYTAFDPSDVKKRDLVAITGSNLPPSNLGHPDYEVADLTGDGLPDVLEMNGTVRYWRNLGNGRFDLPVMMREAPPARLADPGVQMLDANGDGQIELMVTAQPLSGYYSLNFNGHWDPRSFQPYRAAPSFNLKDPEVKLLDLDGNGVTDALRSSTNMECYLNDRYTGWDPKRVRAVPRKALSEFPNVNFSDPRVKLADMTGDGLQDILLIHNGRVDYWPNLGYGNWGKRVTMTNCPRYNDPMYQLGYDPKRLLVGDVDGDGAADFIYVGDHKVTLWINRGGSTWSNPIEITGTPAVTDMDSVRLVDLLGSGVSGVLWSADANSYGQGRPCSFFLDLTGGAKPYLLNEMDNHLGATTKVEYKPSTIFYLADQKNTKTRWTSHLPFPVQVVARVAVIDHFSQGKLTTEYRYHQGYWDGAEREFRGFGMVEQLDTETFDRYNTAGLHGEATPFLPAADSPLTGPRKQFFSHPTLTRTWFHQGPVGPEFGAWENDLDLSGTFWKGDRTILDPWEQINQFLSKLGGNTSRQRRIRRDALRTLRGSILRTELYALDRLENQDQIDPDIDRPYTVTESQYGLTEVDSPAAADEGRQHIFYSHLIAQRTTQWERGYDPLTAFSFTSYSDENGHFDKYGRPRRQTQIACPHGWRALTDQPGNEYLATRTYTDYAERDDQTHFFADRVKRVTTFGYRQSDTKSKTVIELSQTAIDDAILKCIGQTVNYYDGFDGSSQPETYGQLGDYGVVTMTETLAFDEDILAEAYGSQRPPYLTAGPVTWPAEYPVEFRNWVSGLPGRAGYVLRDHSVQPHYQMGYYVAVRHHYDVQDDPATGRGLVVMQYDPLGHATTISYDHQLLPSKVKDAVALETAAEYNYRVLQPSVITDPNGNRTAVQYSPIGLPLSIAVIGKPGNHDGDRRREPDLVAGTFAVDYPSQYFEYNLKAYLADPPKPVYVRSFKRQDHYWDVINSTNAHRRADGRPDLTEAEIDALFAIDEDTMHPERFVETREYSDGFGRLLQTRTQGEEERFGDATLGNGVVPAAQGDTHDRDAIIGAHNPGTGTPNVIVSGWQTYDNKGRVVEKYEPYFDEGWDYDPPTSPQGAKATMFYDPRGQVVRTLNPDGSEQRVIYGVPGSLAHPDPSRVDAAGNIIYEPTPWQAYTYDANDLAPLSHAPDGTSLAGLAPTAHHYTPSNIEIDALGNTIRAVQRETHEIVTRSEYDLLGNLVKVVDALGRDAFIHVFDLAKQRLYLKSIDAGERWTVFDAAGSPIEGRDSRGARVLHAYDILNRLSRVWARNDTNRPVTLREQMSYGDAGDPGQSSADRDANRQLNRLGKLALHNDEAGMLQFEQYDFKGNLRKKVRQVVADSAIPTDQPFQIDWDHAPALDPAEYTTETEFDALNRLRLDSQSLSAGGTASTRKTLQPHYNRAGALEAVSLDGATYVERIAYNPKGQRTLVAYGNGMMTRSAYDPQTFRLARLRTESFTASGLQYQPAGTVRQDLAYEYDLVGNITAIHGRAPDCGLPAHPDQLDRQFTYDAIYRLRSADGRECDLLPPSPPWDDTFRCDDITKARYYRQSYEYDDAGNLRDLQHTWGASGSYARNFVVQSDNNRLDKVKVGNTDYVYDYDNNGNMILENTDRHLQWDHADRLARFTIQANADSPASLQAQYLYDAVGMRVKKWVCNQQGQIETTVYIDDMFEHQRWASGENMHMHVMDNQSRVAIVREGPAHPDDKGVAVEYHLGEHLGSSTVVIGGSNAQRNDFINREEYYPYGETSFGSFGRKRYRFTGKERDGESGLYYHGARYYAPWLARWTSCDPLFRPHHVNLYVYTLDNPQKLVDPSGMAETNSPASATARASPDLTQSQIDVNKVELYEFKDDAGQVTKRQVGLRNPENIFVEYNAAEGCYAAARKSVEKAAPTEKVIQGPHLMDPKHPAKSAQVFPPRLLVYAKARQQDETMSLSFDAKRTQDALRVALTPNVNQGRPVVVGVNEGGRLARSPAGELINKGITSHYLVITGYQEELRNGKWVVTELYGMDNATGNQWLAKDETWPTFRVEPSGRIFKEAVPPGPGQGAFAANEAYTVTEIRVFKKDFESVKSLESWLGPKEKLVPVPVKK